MPEMFVLIAGRSAKQGTTLNEGKQTDDYLTETGTLRMNPDDMQRLGIEAGNAVRVWNEVGEIEVPVENAKQECPPGLVFMSYGNLTSRLMAGETHASGMPTSKGLDVNIEAVAAEQAE